MVRSRRGKATWRAALSLLVARCGVACTPPAPTAVAPVPTTRRWALFDTARRWPSASPPFPSRGHGVEGGLIDVHVSPPSLAAYVRGDRRGMSGAVTIAAFHRRQVDGAPGSVFVMTRSAVGKFQFIVLDRDGRISAEDPLPLCARCHAEAPGQIFGLPWREKNAAGN